MVQNKAGFSFLYLIGFICIGLPSHARTINALPASRHEQEIHSLQAYRKDRHKPVYEGDSLSFKVQNRLITDTLRSVIDPYLDHRAADIISLVMVGDVMLGTDFPDAGYLPPGNDCWPLLAPLADKLRNANITFCNLEGSIAGERGVAKNCKDPKTCYVFRMPEEYASCITQAGIDLVSVANNHVNDFGYEGQRNTVRVLEEHGIYFAGFADYPYTIFESEGLRIGFCAFAPHKGVQDLRDLSKARHLIRMLDDSCDIVLVSMHAGAEGAKYQHVTRKKETFLGADRGNVYAFAHAMIDEGADVVIGHGPHVTRAMEIYKDRFIAYSLGNFSTYGRFNISGPNGIAPLVKLYLDPEGKFLKGEVVSIRQTGEGGALPDPDKKIISKLQDLIKLDFPENGIRIDKDGNISYINQVPAKP